MFIQDGKTIDYANGGATAIVYGAVIPLTNCIGISGEAIAVGATGSVHLEGVFELAAINTAAFTVGDRLFWAGIAANVKLLGTAAELQGQFVKGSRFTVTFAQVAAADVAKTFFIAPAACKILSAQERHVTVAGQAGTLTIEKLTTGEAPGSGDVLLAAAFTLTSTANTPVEKAAVATEAASLAKGDALCLKLASGDATSYDLGTITVEMEWL